ncbi:MAG: hypothetical protein BroJett030_32190 [Alphaproteobacteria bacterium]|nr:MAG: hypothetical protein BroJett030_32190 [Alphaproteobacteria bacterium]
MRALIVALLIAAAGLALGGASAWYTIARSQGFGAITIGPWTAIPFAGAGEIDPYTIAKSVIEGSVPLGASEGLAFNAVTDSDGRELTMRCDYEIEGATPAARLWTLVAYGADGRPAQPAQGGVAALWSGAALRYPDGSFRISVSRHPRPGNWLALASGGPLRLTLRLYDTPVTGGSSLINPRMPSIRRGDCLP